MNMNIQFQYHFLYVRKFLLCLWMKKICYCGMILKRDRKKLILKSNRITIDRGNMEGIIAFKTNEDVQNFIDNVLIPYEMAFVTLVK